jgi:ribonuclease P protein component
MEQTDFSFAKKEKLCSRKTIDHLFNKGNAFMTFPVRVQYLFKENPEDVPVQALFTVSKKRFKRAVKRNLLKRRMREAYRLNKHLLYNVLNTRNLQMAIAFMYVANKEHDYQTIEKEIKKALLRLVAESEKIKEQK